MTQEEQGEFQRMLEHSNSQLNDWLLFGVESYDDAFSPIIEKIKSSQLISHT